MFNVILSAREFNGHWAAAWPGELDLADAPSIAAHRPAAVAAYSARVIVDLAGLEYIDSSGPGVLVRVLKCAQGSGDQRRYHRACTRSGSATPPRAAGPPRWRDPAPPARTTVRVAFRLDPHDEKGLRPAQATSASVPAVSGHDRAAVPAARPKRRAFPGRADQIAKARDFTRRVLASCPVLDEAVLLVSESLVELIAGRWGYCGDERGRTIWLELRGKNC